MCPFIMVNVLRVFYHYNHGAEVKLELEHVRRLLLNRGYVDGAEHYLSAQPVLYLLSCSITANASAPELQSLGEPAAAALRERVGRRGDSFAVAARVLAC